MKKPNSTIARLLEANKKNPLFNVMSQSKYISKEVIAKTSIPLLNACFSGKVDGGIMGGSHQIVGESRTFKTNVGLAAVAAYLDADEENIAIFCDSERGANAKYWNAFNIDMDRVIHMPIRHVEELQHGLLHNLEKVIPDVNKVIIFIDSIAQLPSKKEYEDMVEENGTKDMSRAGALNSFWRCITPVINFRDIPLVWINGFYKEMGNKYAEEIYKGGQQGLLSCDNLWFITRSQIKDDKELVGWNFNISIRKGRFTKEKLVMPLTVMYNGGIYRWSGMLETMILLGFINQSGAWYQRTEASGLPDAKKRQKKDMDDLFFMTLLEQPQVVEALNEYYGVSNGTMLTPLQEELQNALIDKGVSKLEEEDSDPEVLVN
ncbi:RecA protein [Vibrio phage vB_VchM_Kuja]|uniref:RecA protein n=1 Tax=Vibrio phage vB_VchM_Kuja TaxID=2686437 RepID=A0A6B9J995_9CAUD|nr:DNA repair protein [Vibrio phage vB_VchM_Kuja]QGZ16133.1 RecA protein [Vibrio phage vB_VchM_Kuja]